MMRHSLNLYYIAQIWGKLAFLPFEVFLLGVSCPFLTLAHLRDLTVAVRILMFGHRVDAYRVVTSVPTFLCACSAS